jgi:hypothetical protein
MAISVEFFMLQFHPTEVTRDTKLTKPP